MRRVSLDGAIGVITTHDPADSPGRRLAPAPSGHRYFRVDGDLLLLELASRLVVKLID